MSTLYSPPTCRFCGKRSTAPGKSTCVQCADPVVAVGTDRIGAQARCGACGGECERCRPVASCGAFGEEHSNCIDGWCHRSYVGLRP
jgi:hypothetical protein